MWKWEVLYYNCNTKRYTRYVSEQSYPNFLDAYNACVIHVDYINRKNLLGDNMIIQNTEVKFDEDFTDADCD